MPVHHEKTCISKFCFLVFSFFLICLPVKGDHQLLQNLSRIARPILPRKTGADAEDPAAKKRQQELVEKVDELLKVGKAVNGPTGEAAPFGNSIRFQDSAIYIIDEPARKNVWAAINRVEKAREGLTRAADSKAKAEAERAYNESLNSAEKTLTSDSVAFAAIVLKDGKWQLADFSKSIKGTSDELSKAFKNPSSIVVKGEDENLEETFKKYGKSSMGVTSGTDDTASLSFDKIDGKSVAVFKPVGAGKTLHLTFDSKKNEFTPEWK